MMNTAAYTFDALTATLTVSSAFLKKASVINSAEYKVLLQFRKDFAELKIEKYQSNSSKSDSLKYSQMENFIGLCANSEIRLETYRRVKNLAKTQSSPYKYVKTWFLNNYANYNEEPVFDENGYVIVKTKAELEAEKKDIEMKIVDSEKELVAA